MRALEKTDQVYSSQHADFLLKIYVGNYFLTSRAIKSIIQEEIGKLADFTIDPLAQANLPDCTRIGKSPTSSFVYFSFSSLSGLEKSTAFLTKIIRRGVTWKKSNLREQDIDFFIRHSPGDRKRQDSSPPRNREQEVFGVDPWSNIPYEDQLTRKKDHCIDVLKSINRDLSDSTHAELGSTFCTFDGILPSVVIEGYRNRVDFCVGLHDGVKDKEKSEKPYLGFNSGSFKDGFRGVTSRLHCKTTPIEVSKLADSVEQWIQKWWVKFPDLLDCHNKDNHEGFWRRVSVRITIKKEIMIIMQTMSSHWLISKQNKTKLAEEKNVCNIPCDLFHFLQEEFVKDLGEKCSSIQWQEFDGRSNAAPFDLSHTLLHGTASLTDYVCKKPFKISANSFFQVNTPSMERMIDRIRSLDFITNDSILLDVCCGTGLIGLCLQDIVNHVVGIEVVPSAVEDAQNNAERIEAKNTDYLCGKAEESCMRIENIIRKLLARQKSIPGNAQRTVVPSIVAIVDPPRNGLHKNVIKWIRRSTYIKHLVYISCDQRALERDGVHLAKVPSIGYPGSPFYGVGSFAVDFFPHTPHVEQVLIMKR